MRVSSPQRRRCRCLRVTAARWTRENKTEPRPAFTSAAPLSRSTCCAPFFSCSSSSSFSSLLPSSISDSTSRSLGGMEVAPAFALLLCVSLRVSLADRRHFEESNSTNADESVDYKDPCKAGTLLLCIFFLFFFSFFISFLYALVRAFGAKRLLI